MFRRISRDAAGLFGLLFLILIIALGLAAPLVSPHDPLGQNLRKRLMPPAWMAGGDSQYPLGTDQLGRDIASRIIYGTRVSLLVGFGTVSIAGTLGVMLGLGCGFFGGLLDDVVMRIADAQLAIPFILLAIAVIGALGSGLLNIIVVLGVTGWVVYARVTRASVLSIRESEFVLAARTVGASSIRIMLRHVLPNCIAPIIVVGSYQLATMIFNEAALSFLGLGVAGTTPSWGNMLGDGRDYLSNAWWLATLPGVALTLTVLSINLVGDWLRDVLDPRLTT